MSGDALALVGDIGGTNARFALVDLAAPEPELRHSRSLPNADFASLQHAIEHYLAGVDARPARAAIAVASPVAADEIRLTNRAWSFSRRELQAALGFDELRLLNDFGAVAWAATALRDGESVQLYGPQRDALRGPVTVIGPGTGLGVGLLVESREGGWTVIETEGGHVAFAPQGEEEYAVWRWIDARHSRVSAERVLAGIGLSYIDAALRGEQPNPPPGAPATLRDPADIVKAAQDGHDLVARRALARFCAVLGSVAGDVALAHGARTLMIAGGIVPRFLPFLRSSAFRERFLAKGRFVDYMERIAVHAIVHPHPGLLGAATALRQPIDA